MLSTPRAKRWLFITHMRLLLILSFLSVFLLLACSSTTTVAPGRLSTGRDTLTVAALKKKISKDHVIVTERNGTTHTGEVVAIRDDWCMVLAEDGISTQTLATGEIARVERHDHFAGALDGFFLGAGAGFLSGGIVGAATAGHSEWAGLSIAIGATVFSAIGAVVGTVVGAFVGDSYDYNFSTPTEARPLSEINHSAGNGAERETSGDSAQISSRNDAK
jgi:hypothetical protein